MNTTQNIYSVLLPIPSNSNSTFDYLYNETKILPIGQVVKVPFGNNKILWGIVREKNRFISKRNLKYIIEINNEYIISKNLLNFIDWVSEWTMSSHGSVLKLIFTSNDVFENKNSKFGWLLSAQTTDVFSKKGQQKFIQTNKRKHVLKFLSNTNPITMEELISKSNASRSIIRVKMSQKYRW